MENVKENVTEEVAKEENVTEETGTQKKKSKRNPEQVIEIIVAIFLGVTALCTAWASWIGSLHGGNQATNYTLSNNLSADGNARWNEASQHLMQDMMTWNQIHELTLNIGYADEKGDTDEVEKCTYQVQKLMETNCSKEFFEAIQWALNSISEGKEVSPFDKEGFVDDYYTEASEVLKEAEETLEKGKQDNAHGDAFGLVGVIYSVVLFMLGIVGTFKHIPNRKIVLGIAIVGFVAATVYMFTIPLPTGFNILSFFGMG